MPIYTVTYKNNPQGLPFISQHWTVQADNEQKAIDKVATSFYEPLREQLKEELIAVCEDKPPTRATYMLTYESVSANGKDTKLSFHDITHHYLTPWYGDIHGGEIERMSFDASTQKAIVFVSFDYALEQRVLESVTQIAGTTPNVLEYN